MGPGSFYSKYFFVAYFVPKANLCFAFQAKLVLHCSHHLSPWNPEWHAEPEEKVNFLFQKKYEVAEVFFSQKNGEGFLFQKNEQIWPEQIEDDLDSTKDRESSKETHGASNKAKLGFSCHLIINHYYKSLLS